MPRSKFPMRTPSPAWLSSSMSDSTSDEAQSPVLPAQQEPGVPEGAHCTIQTLYEGRPRCPCCKNWVEKYPKDVRAAVEEQAETKQKALVARMAKNHGDGKPLVLDSIVVRSSSLRKTLEEVFQGYRGITASLKKLVFRAPFHPFYYRWGVLTRILERQREEDPDAAAYTELLYGLLDAEMRDLRAEINDLLHHRVITYPHLWALFEPGTRVVMNANGNERFFTVIDDEYREEKNDRHKDMSVHARFVEWDGERFVLAKTTFVINEFNGTRAIDELDVFPASFYPALEEAERKAIARGRKFQELRGFHYMSYSGLAMSLFDRPRGRIQRLQRRQSLQRRQRQRDIDGRIVIDAASYFHSNPEELRDFTAFDSASGAPEIKVMDDRHGGMDPFNGRRIAPRPYGYDSESEDSSEELVIVNTPTKRKTEEPIPELTEEQLLLCNTHVRGYTLKFKQWANFDVKNITNVTWKDDAFPKLMLPTGYKNLILSFVESQTAGRNHHSFDDVIEGKGMGVIMLLVGNPGTGKTLTAEAVADKVRRPLYVLRSGELGEYADEVERRLNKALALAEKWNAVLLFYESDVFLQERSMDNLRHNEIVAVFLRVLEYYPGILIMASNRVETIDKAFGSRVHLTLHYPDLEPTARGDIWRHLTTQTQIVNNLTDKEYSSLASLPLNGRQIKNVIKIATLLADQERKGLGIEQIRTVLMATKEIDDESWMKV